MTADVAGDRRIEALLRLLTDEGHMTPYAKRKIAEALRETTSTGGGVSDVAQRPNNPCWRCGASD